MACVTSPQESLRKLVFAPETTCGTAVVASGFVADLADVPSFELRGTQQVQRGNNTDGWGGVPQAVAGSFGWQGSIPLEMHSVLDDPIPAWALFCIAAGMRYVKDAATKTFTLSPSPLRGLANAPANPAAETTIDPFAMTLQHIYRGTVKHVSRASTFGAELVFQVGQTARWNLPFKGLVHDGALAAASPANDSDFNDIGATTKSALPYVCKGATMTLTDAGATNIPIEVDSFTLAFNQALRDNAVGVGPAQGFAPTYPFFSDPPTLAINLGETTQNQSDIWAKIFAQTPVAFEVVMAIASNISIKIEMPSLQYQTIAVANRDGAKQFQAVLTASKSVRTANNSFLITGTYGTP
jgi:hypothetical protein